MSEQLAQLKQKGGGGGTVDAYKGSFALLSGRTGSFSNSQLWYHGTLLNSGSSNKETDDLKVVWSAPSWVVTFKQAGTYVMYGSGITGGVYQQAQNSSVTLSMSGDYRTLIARIDDSLLA